MRWPVGSLRSVVRGTVPLLLIPLAVLADVLAAAPWLRAFPVSVAGAPMYGAAVLSVLVPFAMARLRPQWFWLSILLDAVVFVLYTLLVVLQDPGGVDDLVRGLYEGPSQLLTFALPLVSPRSLMVSPVAVVWLAGALLGECIARRWFSVLPYVGVLVAFGLAYAGTQRAAGPGVAGAVNRETLLAGGLLLTLLVMRVAQSWVHDDEHAETTQPDGVLPMRGLLVGTATAAVVAVLAALLVQADAFPKRADTPQRVPSVVDSKPLTPLAFIADIRPDTSRQKGTPVFTVRTDAPSTGYFEIANVDFYDGGGWSFDRTFRPSGGVLPDDPDASLRGGSLVTQHYSIDAGALTTGPWMPYLYRAQSVTGVGVNIDAGSGMIVPSSGALRGGDDITVTSRAGTSTFASIRAASSTPDTGTSTANTQVPGDLAPTLDRLVRSFSTETGVPSSPALPFLQALQKDLQRNYSLTGNPAAPSGSGTASGSSDTSPATRTSPAKSTSKPTTTTKKTTPTKRTTSKRPAARSSSARRGTRGYAEHPLAAPATRRSSATRSATATPTPTPSASQSSGGDAEKAGSTGFADVLGSILGADRSGTPEQYATLVALVARTLGVPARVATGFRVPPAAGAKALAAGSYEVTTADAWSWVEIPVVGVGWVALDATPARASTAQQPSESAAPATSSSSAPPTRNAQISQGQNSGHAVVKPTKIKNTSPDSRNGLLVAVIVVLLVLLLLVLALLLSRKRVRAARRRRAPDPRVRLVNAWRESLDVLAESGLPELSAMTSSEIARLTGEQFGADTAADAAELGAAANAVVYSRQTPVAPHQADEAWARQRHLQRAVRRQLGVRGRLVAGLRYHRARSGANTPTSPASWATESKARRAASARERRTYRGRRRAH